MNKLLILKKNWIPSFYLAASSSMLIPRICSHLSWSIKSKSTRMRRKRNSLEVWVSRTSIWVCWKVRNKVKVAMFHVWVGKGKAFSALELCQVRRRRITKRLRLSIISRELELELMIPKLILSWTSFRRLSMSKRLGSTCWRLSSCLIWGVKERCLTKSKWNMINSWRIRSKIQQNQPSWVRGCATLLWRKLLKNINKKQLKISLRVMCNK